MHLDVSKKSDYAIATALRGPDFYTVDTPLIKATFTAVIRYFCGMDESHGAIVKSPEQATAMLVWLNEKAKRRVINVLHEHPHFVSHWKFAIEALCDNYYNQDKDRQDLRRITRYVRFLIKQDFITEVLLPERLFKTSTTNTEKES